MLKQQEQMQQAAPQIEFKQAIPESKEEVTVSDVTDSEDLALYQEELSAVATPPSLLRRSLSVWRNWKKRQKVTAVLGTAFSLIATLASSFLQTHSQATAAVDTSVYKPGMSYSLTAYTASEIPRQYWVMSRMVQGVDYYVTRDELYQDSHRIDTWTIPVDLTRGDMKPSSRQWRVTIHGKGFLALHGYSRGNANEKMTDFTSVKINNDQHPVEISVRRLENSRVRAVQIDRRYVDFEPGEGTVEALSIPPAQPKDAF